MVSGRFPDTKRPLIATHYFNASPWENAQCDIYAF